MTSSSTSDHPLNCLSDTGDGFSGWFAISNPRKCNDFCYWAIDTGGGDDGDEYDGDEAGYTSYNTADPHHTTVIINNDFSAYWVCVYNAAGDDFMASQAEGQRWVDTWQKFSTNTLHARQVDKYQQLNDSIVKNHGVSFPYLKCQKGAGEELTTWDEELVKSAPFWECWIVISSLIYLAELILGVSYWKKRKISYEMITGAASNSTAIDSYRLNAERQDSEDSFHSLQLTESVNNTPPTFQDYSVLLASIASTERIHTTQHQHTTTRFKVCTPVTSKLCNTSAARRRWIMALRIVTLLLFNALLAFTVAFSSISLMEIHKSPFFKENMQQWTPACSNPDLVCEAGNRNIDRPSLPWNSTKDNDASYSQTSREMPFSYIIASDAQLYWFNGEFAQMGEQNIPTACSPNDTCGRCTKKHGYDTNIRLKRGWEALLTGEVDGMERRRWWNGTGERLPVPDTLIMNGDLTAYFHPYEKHVYDSIYNDIQGLKAYFPGLGNHDIEHMGGAKYGGDQWNGPPNCNIEHAIGYLKSGFCGKIPNFHADKIVRYDSSSLAYSWDEGRYHFVHTHYYPTYEMASMQYQSSIDWLERDLTLARSAGLATVLFVHAANYLIPLAENVILGKNVVAIIAGHDHRCLHRRCEGIYPIREDQVDNLNATGLHVEKCIPAAYDICQVLNGENLINVKDMDAQNVSMPAKKLENIKRTDKPLCPKPAPFFINDTDNSLLCRKVRYNYPNFPPSSDKNSSAESIPMFWSGSSSFETFLRADFFDDHLVVNAMSLTKDGSVSRYIDVHDVPNARYPYHEKSDLEEVQIHLS
ncbi:hypothetical protein HJC23_002689 [Cyclotella cryptica]|uniref:Calcineurin-like phosphoesterase domain-containing protein n=1 Tax=Cyclotella cryptica TaxID=29204 RepID=A0ABD3NS64_9STRA|eukprot:CCRYP_020015-RA/>CCRYP_020015-RA protein AED:0.12 eAED:0.12 QI:176/1/1/1/1/1/3/92/812